MLARVMLVLGCVWIAACNNEDRRTGDSGAAADASPPDGAGCFQRSDCPDRDHCVAVGPGMCGEAGRCVPPSSDCGPDPDPVCGCDGMTYVVCALPDGVFLDHRGPCE